METDGVQNKHGTLLKELTVTQAVAELSSNQNATDDVNLFLPCAIRACEAGVARTHLISRHTDGAILQELFSNEGIGTMVVESTLNALREATIEDVGGILQLLIPLEEQGILVRRSRELLEREIERFVVLEHDHRIVGCAALYPFPDEAASRTRLPGSRCAMPRSRLWRGYPQPYDGSCQDTETEKTVRADHAHRALVSRTRLQGKRCNRAAQTKEIAV